MIDFKSWTEAAAAYFAQLNEQEKYCWIAELVGLLLVIFSVFFL